MNIIPNDILQIYSIKIKANSDHSGSLLKIKQMMYELYDVDITSNYKNYDIFHVRQYITISDTMWANPHFGLGHAFGCLISITTADTTLIWIIRNALSKLSRNDFTYEIIE